MLVLTREVGQKIKIGDDITLVVIKISQRKVRIGIDADRSIPVFRSELLNQGDPRDGDSKEK